MVAVTAAFDTLNRILPAGADAASVINAEGSAPICLVCEHAGAGIPDSLADLGLAPEHRYSHAAWDIGAVGLAIAMAQRLGAPLVIAPWSRLIYDLNRPPDAPDAIPERTEVIDIPGNRDIGEDERAARIRELYEPFHATVAKTLDAYPTPPAFVTIHSFTPVWHGVRRDTEIGFLHDADPLLAHAMLAAWSGPHKAELNRPYSAEDGVTHTLAKHATSRGLANVMIEVRNDLIPGRDEVDPMADHLTSALLAATGTVRQ